LIILNFILSLNPPLSVENPRDSFALPHGSPTQSRRVASAGLSIQQKCHSTRPLDISNKKLSPAFYFLSGLSEPSHQKRYLVPFL